MGFRLLAPDVVQVVGHDVLETHFRTEAQELLVEAVLRRKAVILELQEEAVRSEDVAVLAREAARRLPVVHLEGLGDLAAQAGG